jgi:glycosyltransferase involved in cell wall biosynthesis
MANVPDSSRAIRLLLSAYQCGPGMGSVSQIGWEWYRRLAQHLQVTLITHVRNRPALLGAGAPIDDSEIIFVDTEWFAGPVYRTAKRLFPQGEHAVFLLAGIDFFMYDLVALRLLRRRMTGGSRWDVIHAVTPVTTIAATRLYKLGAPLIVGPLNSGIVTPPGFNAILRGESFWLVPLRNLGGIVRSLAGTARNSKVILTANRTTVASLPARHRPRCVSMLENSVDLMLFTSSPWPPPPSRTTPLRVLFVGRLVPVKALGLLLEAVARVRDEIPLELEVIGDGPMASAWRRHAEQLTIKDRVNFRGSCSLLQVAAAMRSTHVLCLPSVRESGGAVLLEAMASGRPVIAVAFGGPAEIVDESVGHAIPPNGVEAVITGLIRALRDIVDQPEAWRRRGEAGRRRAETRFSWDANIGRAIEIYRSVIRTHDSTQPVITLSPGGGDAAGRAG